MNDVSPRHEDLKEWLAQWSTQAVSLEVRDIYPRVSGSSTHKHLSIKYLYKHLGTLLIIPR